MKYRVKVTVTQLVHEDELNYNDVVDNPKGTYSYTVTANRPAAAKERALDEFHEAIPIKVLDHFEITTEARKL